jgi:hypothetical protein
MNVHILQHLNVLNLNHAMTGINFINLKIQLERVL